MKRFCMNCGTELPEVAAFCPKCGEKFQLPTCPSCGKELDFDADFCIYCGASMGKEPASEAGPAAAPEPVPEPEPTAEEARFRALLEGVTPPAGPSAVSAGAAEAAAPKKNSTSVLLPLIVIGIIVAILAAALWPRESEKDFIGRWKLVSVGYNGTQISAADEGPSGFLELDINDDHVIWIKTINPATGRDVLNRGQWKYNNGTFSYAADNSPKSWLSGKLKNKELVFTYADGVTTGTFRRFAP